MRFLKCLLILPFFMIFVNCDFGTNADNGDLKVINNTAYPIRVYYSYEEEESGYDSSGEVVVIGETAVVDANSSRTIKIQSNLFYNGQIDVVYGGIKKHYNINFDFFDQATKTVSVSDFQIW